MTLLIIIILALAIVALYPLVREFIQRRRATVPAYVEALRLVLDGRDGEAIPLLKDAVNSEPDNIDGWIRLGDAYIRTGELERGVRIHENLGLRRNLRPDDERKVLTTLARDYIRTDRKLKAISTLEELARGRDHEAIEHLLELYIGTGSWEKCRTLVQDLKHGERDHRWLARLTAGYARGISSHDPETARSAFEDALRLDGRSVTARLYYGDFLLERGEVDEALRRWQEILELAPERSAAVRPRLERAYYELGRYDEITRLYEQLLRKVPNDTGLAVALALIHRKKGNHDEAIRLMHQACAGDSNPLCNAAVAAVELDRGRTDAAARALDALLDQLRKTPEDCRHCGQGLAEPVAVCPSCGKRQAQEPPAKSS